METYIATLKQAIITNKDNTRKIGKDTAENISLPAEMRKSLGAFFTETKLSSAAIHHFQQAITAESVVLDPCCGVGNLLIEASRQLGVMPTLSATLRQWGSVLWGYDIRGEFIRITQLRLIIEALARGVQLDCSVERAMALLKHIQVADALNITTEQVSSVTHLFINPPFLPIDAPKRDYWKQGKVNSAGVFLDYYLRILAAECDVVAILPDVLRSGSRYHLFRDFVNKNLQGKSQIWGRFSDIADVDVFILAGKIRNTTEQIQWVEPVVGSTVLGDKYDVMVGPLVAYRDKQEGSVYPYFHPKNCKNWKMVTEVSESRAFSGKVIQPPCVVIKRTSSPSDKYRAAATLIDLPQPVAVENHLIVVIPKDGKLKSCRQLLKLLAKPQINRFLNEQIRVRHLTVGVIKSIPLLS